MGLGPPFCEECKVWAMIDETITPTCDFYQGKCVVHIEARWYCPLCDDEDSLVDKWPDKIITNG